MWKRSTKATNHNMQPNTSNKNPHSQARAPNSNIRSPAPKIYVCRATQLYPRFDLLKSLDEPIAVDIEFQLHKSEGDLKWKPRLGRIAVVNSRGDTIYDTFVRHEWKSDLKVRPAPRRFGVTMKDLKVQNGATMIYDVEKYLNILFQGRTVVFHSMENDKKALGSKMLRLVKEALDTQHFYGKKKLVDLVEHHLNLDDFKWHDPTQDPKATMLLYIAVLQQRAALLNVSVEQLYPLMECDKQELSYRDSMLKRTGMKA